MTWEKTYNVIDIVATLLGLLGPFFALFAWRRAKRLQHDLDEQQNLAQGEITVFVQRKDGNKLEVPFRPRREQLSRGELRGILSVFAAGARLKLPDLFSVFTSGDFAAMVDGKTNKLTIPCADEDFAVFQQEKNDFDEEKTA